MIEFVILNLENNERFTKIFNSLYLANKFKNKVKYSKKIKIVSEVNL